ncbi:DegV family protein with EDD domain [Acetoanaerobium pronyense]|uniref:DegV family protein with EDD domain n=1 Tax=Acetoanaerobium pronyense TaxID=1482736 RepID=A0ABS4KIY8_9FIRM|nr:DegV family protein [Acetoanaerobium pronyense]MBP2027749.1 DegV family protein with EDD domain [Acetoanaerobium pronyense]
MSVKIITDSTSYIGENILKELDISLVSLSVEFDGEVFKETEITNEHFYKLMSEKGIPKSSQPAIDDIQTSMENIVKNGDDALCVFLSSKMSGTFSTAHMAKDMVLEKYPNANIDIIDSKSNCMELGFKALIGAAASIEGKTIAQISKIVLDNIKRSRFLFIPHNLVYLEKGGRIGKANAMLGNLLKIIPILTVEDGVTSIFKKVRTKKRAISSIIDKVVEDMKNFGGLGDIVVHHINCTDEAKAVANQIKDILGIENVKIHDIGPVIGLHVGPGAIGIAYYTNEDMR